MLKKLIKKSKNPCVCFSPSELIVSPDMWYLWPNNPNMAYGTEKKLVINEIPKE